MENGHEISNIKC